MRAGKLRTILFTKKELEEVIEEMVAKEGYALIKNSVEYHTKTKKIDEEKYKRELEKVECEIELLNQPSNSKIIQKEYTTNELINGVKIHLRENNYFVHSIDEAFAVTEDRDGEYCDTWYEFNGIECMVEKNLLH